MTPSYDVNGSIRISFLAILCSLLLCLGEPHTHTHTHTGLAVPQQPAQTVKGCDEG